MLTQALMVSSSIYSSLCFLLPMGAAIVKTQFCFFGLWSTQSACTWPTQKCFHYLTALAFWIKCDKLRILSINCVHFSCVFWLGAEGELFVCQYHWSIEEEACWAGADEQKVAGMQRAPWWLRMGRRGVKEEVTRILWGFSIWILCHIQGQSRGSGQRMCARREQEGYIKHYYHISSAYRAVTSQKASEESELWPGNKTEVMKRGKQVVQRGTGLKINDQCLE